MPEWEFLSTEQYLARLMWELGIVPTEAAGLRVCAGEDLDGTSVRRLTQALMLVREHVVERWQRDGDSTPAEALDRAAADHWARLGLSPGPGRDAGGSLS